MLKASRQFRLVISINNCCESRLATRSQLARKDMPRPVDPLAELLQAYTDDTRRDFHAAVLRPLVNKPPDDVYVDVRSTASTHPDRPTWTQMRSYQLCIYELRKWRPATAAAAHQLLMKSRDLHLRMLTTHVHFDEWNVNREMYPSKLLAARSFDLSLYASATSAIMLFAGKIRKRLSEKEAKQRRAVFEQVARRLSREVARRACSNVVAQARNQRRVAALARLQTALLPWVRARVSYCRQKSARLKAVIALNQRLVACKVRRPERV